jgi:hypothetical protein
MGGKEMARHYRAAFLVLSVTLFAAQGYAQSPPTATEAFNLRIQCKKMSDEKADELRWHPANPADGASIGMSPAAVTALNNHYYTHEVVAEWNTSKYDPVNNRCYGRIYGHIKTNDHGLYDNEYDQVYDLQTSDLLAHAEIKNGKKWGSIWDSDYKQPPLPLSCLGECQENFTWQAAEDYMDKIMADPRKQ